MQTSDVFPVHFGLAHIDRVRHFFGFSDLAEDFLDVTRREGGSTSHRNLSLHQVEKVFRFQAQPSLSFYRVFDNGEKHFSCYSVVEANLCQSSSYVLSDLLVSISCDDYECTGLSTYNLVQPTIQLIL